MKEIVLYNGEVALVDDDKVELVSHYSWWLDKDGYALTLVEGKQTLMHHLVYGKKVMLDHKNGNKLDNTANNLRPCNKSTNAMNQKKWSKPTSSRYKGVSLFKRTGKYAAYIKKDGKRTHLGYFLTEKEAALAYNNKAKELFGEFAKLNKVGE